MRGAGPAQARTQLAAGQADVATSRMTENEEEPSSLPAVTTPCLGDAAEGSHQFAQGFDQALITARHNSAVYLLDKRI